MSYGKMSAEAAAKLAAKHRKQILRSFESLRATDDPSIHRAAGELGLKILGTDLRTALNRTGSERDEILEGMARAAFVTHWADEREEEGESFSGQDIMDVAPRKNSEESVEWANNLAPRIEKANGKSLDELYALASAANEEGGGGRTTQDAETFGHYLAMQAMGHGVAWDDDIAGGHDLIKIPYSEFYG